MGKVYETSNIIFFLEGVKDQFKRFTYMNCQKYKFGPGKFFLGSSGWNKSVSSRMWITFAIGKFQKSFIYILIFQINHGASRSLEDVMASVKKNNVALKGVIGIPEVRRRFYRRFHGFNRY